MKNIILKIIIAVFVILFYAPDVVTHKNPVLLTSHGYGRNSKILEAMLTARKNINARDNNGWTVLIHAAIRDDFEILEILHDADVNARDNEGRTALIIANYDIRNPEVIKYLIRLEADEKARDNKGYTVSMSTSEENNEFVPGITDLLW